MAALENLPADALSADPKIPTIVEEKEVCLYPVHPIPQLQGAFEESIEEANKNTANECVVEIDAQTRRRDLLENDEYERICGRKWRQKGTEKYHPLWKLIAQMAFGVHLLAKKLAKSKPQVMKILQDHVDELDGVLQRTTEDFLIIELDVRTRIQYLSLPLGNLDVFDEMLEDRTFRLSLVAYNDQIEHAVDRFTLALTDTLKDLRKGKEAISALWLYMIRLADGGCFESDSLKPFYQTMMDNLEGWLVALWKLRRRGTALLKALRQLAVSTNEMQRRVGIASRKDVRSFAAVGSSQPAKHKLFTRRPTTPWSRPMSSNKPLPRDPSLQPRRSVQTPARTPVIEPGNNRPTQTEVAKEAKTVQALNRAKSCSALVPADSTPPVTSPQTPGRLSRKLSKPFLSKRLSTMKLDNTQSRPATAPARALKSRSASIEHLKSFWSNGHLQTPPHGSTADPAANMYQPTSARFPVRGESMKEQISQYLKTDRVVDAWDTVANKTGNCGRTLTKTTKGWPSSVFRAKPSDALRIRRGNKDGLSPTGLRRQMSWAQDEPEILNTYSFKRRPEISPRIHVVSVQMILDEDMNFGEDTVDGASEVGGDAGSIITALPSLSIQRPQTVDCAQG